MRWPQPAPRTAATHSCSLRRRSRSPAPWDRRSIHLRSSSHARAAGVLALAFACGAAALAVEVTWQRWLRVLFGATAPAAAATLVAFLAGGALGAWGASRRLARVERPLWTAGMLMAGAAALARVVPTMLRAL